MYRSLLLLLLMVLHDTRRYSFSNSKVTLHKIGFLENCVTLARLLARYDTSSRTKWKSNTKTFFVGFSINHRCDPYRHSKIWNRSERRQITSKANHNIMIIIAPPGNQMLLDVKLLCHCPSRRKERIRHGFPSPEQTKEVKSEEKLNCWVGK